MIRFNFPGDGGLIAKHSGGAAGTFNPACDISIGHIINGQLIGGVIFNSFNHESIQIHSASWDPHWIDRDMLFVTFDYPFNQLGVKRLFGLVPADNEHALSFNRKVGFKDVAHIDGVFPGDIACVVMRLDRDDCRFLNVRPRSIMARGSRHG